MRNSIHDRDALLVVSPTALSSYACAAGWIRRGTYREHSNIYTGEDKPEIIVPRTDHLGDYASVVAELIKIFAEVGDQSETSVYRSLVTTDRDVVRLRVGESEEGSVKLNEGVDLIQGARDMLLAAACSLSQSKAAYRAGANRDATDLISRIRLGQTDRGSFVVTLLTPIIPPPVPSLFQDEPDPDIPIERRLTARLIEALTAIRVAVEETASGDGDAFRDTTRSGVSANLCEALVKIIGSFPTLDVSVSWAQIRPNTEPSRTVRFGSKDEPLLRQVVRMFREYAPRPNAQLTGNVRLLKREEDEEDGTIRLNTLINDKPQSVTALLGREDYDQAVQSHKDQTWVILSGDLERMGQRWRLLNPRLKHVLPNEESDYND